MRAVVEHIAILPRFHPQSRPNPPNIPHSLIYAYTSTPPSVHSCVTPTLPHPPLQMRSKHTYCSWLEAAHAGCVSCAMTGYVRRSRIQVCIIQVPMMSSISTKRCSPESIGIIHTTGPVPRSRRNSYPDSRRLILLVYIHAVEASTTAFYNTHIFIFISISMDRPIYVPPTSLVCFPTPQWQLPPHSGFRQNETKRTSRQPQARTGA